MYQNWKANLELETRNQKGNKVKIPKPLSAIGNI